MHDYLVMTPGPTPIRENVRQAMAKPITNPDLDSDFYLLYEETVNLFKTLVQTEASAYILCGEGILGLEAACASLIEPGDRVLCIENGIFGKGFGDFVKMYGGEVVYFSGHPQRGIRADELEAFLKKDNDFKLATLVHCETPSGITNPIHTITPLLKRYNIASVVDAVSAVGGEAVETDAWGIDILLVGSQKCLSAAPGLTLLTVSEKAEALMANRKTPIVGFYTNLTMWQGWKEKQWFPYTQPISDIFGLKVALENALEEETLLRRHHSVGEACRQTVTAAGLKLFPEDSHSNTVTAIQQPTQVDFDQLFDYMKREHKILIAGAFGPLKDKVIRLGHMGENARPEMMGQTLGALQEGLMHQGVEFDMDMRAYFDALI